MPPTIDERISQEPSDGPLPAPTGTINPLTNPGNGWGNYLARQNNLKTPFNVSELAVVELLSNGCYCLSLYGKRGTGWFKMFIVYFQGGVSHCCGLASISTITPSSLVFNQARHDAVLQACMRTARLMNYSRLIATEPSSTELGWYKTEIAAYTRNGFKVIEEFLNTNSRNTVAILSRDLTTIEI